MKKSIFLFFAAILCAMSANAKTIYLNAGGSSLWDQAGAVFTAKVSTTEYPMTKVFGSYYEGAVPDDATKVTFMRNNPNGGNWNKTSQLTIPTDGKNCYNITQWSSGNWSTYPPTFYIAGDFVTPNWSENAAANKMDYADGVYSKSYDNVAASAHQFKITNGTWSNAIGYDKNTCSGTNCTVEDGGGNIKFTPLAEGTVTITYTIADGKVHITCPEPPAAEFNITYPATQTNYTLVAGPAKAQTGAEVSFTATPAEGYVLNVTYNGNAITGNNNVYTFMMPAADVTIAITAVAATTLYYVDNSNWGNANAYMWNDHGNNGWPGAAMALVGTVGDDAYSYYSISFAQGAYTSIIFNNGNGSQTADLTIKTETPYFYDGAWYTWDDLLAKLAAPVVKTYTVVGSSVPLFGEAWATAKAENDMTLVEGTKYQLVKSDIALTAGEILYKVAVNHAWDEAYPGENAKLTISEAGKYTVTFTFDSNTKAVDAIAELTEAAVVLPTVGVKGAWDGWAATTTLTGDNTSASATVNIATAGIYEFGLDVDGNFQASGATIDKTNNSTVVTKNDANMKLTANVLGEYTFTWTYETNTLTVTYPAGEEVEIAKKYYLTGSLVGGWDVKQQGIEKDGELYKVTFNALAAGTYEFKITAGDWEHQWNYNNLGAAYEEVSQGVDGEGNPNGNIKITLAAEKEITVIFDGSKITFEGLTPYVAPLTYTVTVPAGTEKCYIAGAFAQSNWNTFVEMTKVGDEDKFTITIAGAKETDEYKYACQADWAYAEVIDGGGNRTNWSELDEVTAWNKPAVVTYVLMGVGGWDQPGIELVQNPGNDKEYMLTCQAISATDAIKVVRLEDGVIKDYYGDGTVKDGVEVTVNYDGDGNITLPEGKYNFYFDTNEPDKKLWIAAATDCGTEPTPDYTRAVTPGNFGTICLPNGGTMVGASIFEIAYKDDSKIYFDEILSNEMVAGIPYIFLPIGGVDQIEVYYTDEANAAANTVNGLVGSYTQELLVADGNNYILLNNQYCEVIGEAYVGANRAYFQLSGIPPFAPAPAPGARRVSMGMAGQNTATGMENVDASAQPVKTIINGQLFILRGEKMYDAQGKLVK